MSKVYVIQQPIPNGAGWVPDLGPASQYGAIEFIFDSTDRVYADPSSAKKKLIAKLSKFNAEEDYLLWPNAGDPASAWLTIAMLSTGGFKKLRYLYWQKPRKGNEGGGHYLPIEIDSSLVGN